MNIVHLVDLFAPSLGGTERVVEDLARRQAALGDQVTVITLTPSEFDVHEEEAFAVIRLSLGAVGQRGVADPGRPYHPPFPLRSVSQALKTKLASLQPDVVIAHSWIALSYLAIREEVGIPVIWYLHDYLLTCPKRTKLFDGQGPCPSAQLWRCLRCSRSQYPFAKAAVVTVGQRLANRKFLGLVDRFVANSADVAHQASEAFDETVVIDVVGAAVDLHVQRIDALQRPEFLPAGDFILFVGQLSTAKGLDLLLEAFSNLHDSSVELVCIGTRQDSTPQIFPRRVTVINGVAHEAVLAAWRFCSFGVLPTRAEAFGLVALEAAAMGRAMVVTNVGGLPELVLNEVTGLVVAPNDTEALRSAMDDLLAHPDKAAQLGLAGQARSAMFTLDAVTDRLQGVIAQLVSPR